MIEMGEMSSRSWRVRLLPPGCTQRHHQMTDSPIMAQPAMPLDASRPTTTGRIGPFLQA